MTPYRSVWHLNLACACCLLLAAASGAVAQFLPGPGQSTPATQFPGASPFPPPPGQQPAQSSAFPPPPGQQRAAQDPAFPPPPGQRHACEAFVPIREAAEKGAAEIRAAGDRKAPRDQVCGMFKRFVVTEAKLVKFLVTHKSQCGIPQQAIAAAQANHSKTIQIRNSVCAAPAAPPGPTLSDALGGPIIADDTSAKQPGRSTFDTLTGNVLSR
jgi:hypothetical protein